MLACAQVTFGVMTGPVNARAEFYDGIEVNTDRRWGMSAGVQLSLPIAKHLGLPSSSHTGRRASMSCLRRTPPAIPTTTAGPTITSTSQ
ncbi:MAG: hypothetical protein IPM12_14925 [Flavobacteriales bacterium]|nr:hypothetical protein [Flavobacteriales bacterium]